MEMVAGQAEKKEEDKRDAMHLKKKKSHRTSRLDRVRCFFFFCEVGSAAVFRFTQSPFRSFNEEQALLCTFPFFFFRIAV